MNTRKPARIIPVILVVAALAAGAVYALNRNGARAVALVSPQRGMAVEAVYATGTVEPENWAKIGPVTTGRIAEMLVDEGDVVKRGQHLARLDDREASAKVNELEARAVYWREELARAKTLADSGIRPRESAQKAKSEYDQANAAINAARQRRTDLLVIAPWTGWCCAATANRARWSSPKTPSSGSVKAGLCASPPMWTRKTSPWWRQGKRC